MNQLIHFTHEPTGSCSFRKFKMRMKGLEPSLLSELEPKSSASANSATSASVNYRTIRNYLWEGEMGDEEAGEAGGVEEKLQ